MKNWVETSTNSEPEIIPKSKQAFLEEAASKDPQPAGPSTTSERVTIMINGAEVDITNTGINPTFLDALPDEMREEVLNQHFREQQPTREELSAPVPSSISIDFLEALPPEIRAEVIHSEVADQQRRRREDDLTQQNAVSGNDRAPADPSKFDPATLLASLDPSQQEAVLLDQDN